MADDEQDVWEQAAKTYKGGTAPSSTPPQASSNQDSSSQASPSNDPWEKAAKTFKANPSQGASSEWDKPEPSFLEKVGNAAGKVGDVAGAAFKGLASLSPSMGGSHIAQPTMGKSGAYNPEQGEAAGAVRQKMASTGAEAGSEAAAGLLKLPLSSGGSHIAQPVREQPSEVSTGIARSIGGNVGGMAADPAMWALAALPGEQMGPIFSRLMSGGFAAQMGSSTAKGVQELARNWDSLNQEQKAEGITNLGIGTALTALTATHATSGVGQLPGKVAEGVKPIADATVRTGAKIYEGSRKAAPGIGAGVGAASGLATGNPAGVALGLLAGERAGRIAERYLPSAEKAKTYGYSPTEKAVSVHTDLASKADKEAAKAEEAHSVYSASEQAHPEWATADPKELKKTNPAYAASREVVENARAKQAEAHYHLQEAKSADAAAKTAAPSVPDQPITAEAVAAARPAPTEGPLAVPEVQPGVSPAHATTINPQEPLAAPRVEETTQPRPLAEGKGVLMGRPPRMLTEGVPEQAPAVPEAPKEVPPVMTAGKPERPSMGGLKVDNTGKVVDTTAGPEAATREALGVERPTKMVPATEGKAVPPEGPLAKYTPEKAPAEAPKEAPRAEPTGVGGKSEVTGKPILSNEEVLANLSDKRLAEELGAMGADTKGKNWGVRDENRHRTERNMSVTEGVKEKMSDADRADMTKAAEAFANKDTNVFDEVALNAASKAERSEAILKEYKRLKAEREGGKVEGAAAVHEVPKEGLKVGDTFVDEAGEPRRVTAIEGDKIRTADGTLRTYDSTVKAQGEVNSAKAKLAQGGKAHNVDEGKIESQAIGFGRKGGMPNVNEEGKWGDITSEHPDLGPKIKPERITPAKLTQEIKSEPGYVYHATNAERLQAIADEGQLNIHKPSHGTDQEVWPDGSTEKRAYFTSEANTAWQFAPEEGIPVAIRVKDTGLKVESTGDHYSKAPIKSDQLEFLGKDGDWHPVDSLREPKPLETPKEFKEKPEEPKGSPEHTYTYEQSGDSHQVTVRDPEGKSVALITAREEKPGIWTTKFSASSEHGEGFKGYTRLMDAAKAEAQRSGKPVTVRGDDEMTPAAVRTWGKLGDSYDISWNKEHRPSVTFRPTKMNAEGSKMK